MVPHLPRLAFLGAVFILPGPALAAPIAIVNAGFEDPYFGSNLPPEYNGDVPAGSFPVGPAPAGWFVWDPGNALNAGAYVGVLNPGTQADYGADPAFFPNGAPEGDNAALLYVEGDAGGSAYGIEQPLNAALAPDTQYTLTVEVGNIASGTGLVAPFSGFGFYNLDGFPGYRVELLAVPVGQPSSSGTVLAFDENGIPGLADAEGEFMTSILTYAPLAAGDPLIGQTLWIRLINLNNADVPGVRGLETDFDNVRLDATPAAVPSPDTLALLAAGLPWIARTRPRGRCSLRTPGRR
jgi:hypothetical protein